jgi:hypothetical protein
MNTYYFVKIEKILCKLTCISTWVFFQDICPLGLLFTWNNIITIYFQKVFIVDSIYKLEK